MFTVIFLFSKFYSRLTFELFTVKKTADSKSDKIRKCNHRWNNKISFKNQSFFNEKIRTKFVSTNIEIDGNFRVQNWKHQFVLTKMYQIQHRFVPIILQISSQTKCSKT